MLIVTSSDEIQFLSKEKLESRVSIASLVFVGEYTTNVGPADDYFLDFASVKNGQWTWSWVTVGTGTYEAIVALGDKLGQPLRLELVNSVDCKSRAMWPPEWADRPYRRMCSYNGFLDAFVRFMNMKGRDFVLTDEVTSYISGQARRQPSGRR